MVFRMLLALYNQNVVTIMGYGMYPTGNIATRILGSPVAMNTAEVRKTVWKPANVEASFSCTLLPITKPL